MALRATFCVLRIFSQDVTCILEDTSSCVYSVSCASFVFFPKTPKTDVILLMLSIHDHNSAGMLFHLPRQPRTLHKQSCCSRSKSVQLRTVSCGCFRSAGASSPQYLKTSVLTSVQVLTATWLDKNTSPWSSLSFLVKTHYKAALYEPLVLALWSLHETPAAQ